ncbi:MAG: T9SS type A sorting domain-containing protein, partial [Tannerellaceae bacterium]|nr:T9SS type A sorting domain-containing protein [Tannerellaceae bacterium]
AIGSDGVRVWVDAPRSRIQILLPQEETFTYRLYSVTGQLLQESLISGNQADIPVAELHPGIYIIQLSGKKIFHTQKVCL